MVEEHDLFRLGYGVSAPNEAAAKLIVSVVEVVWSRKVPVLSGLASSSG
jgi:hypothetical protein